MTFLPRPSRRLLLISALAIPLVFAGCRDSSPRSPKSAGEAVAVGGEVRLRIVAANLTSGGRQAYPIDGPGRRILDALDPDVVLIQEFLVDGGSRRELVDAALGADYEICVEQENGGIPNGVISRFPILDCFEWEDDELGRRGNRDFAVARIDLPGERDLWAVSVHFKASEEDAARRERQGKIVVREIRRLLEQGKMADADFLVVGGDFNTHRRGESVLDQLDDVIRVEQPFPTGPTGREGTNAGRRKPYDWVLADKDLEPLEIPVEIAGRAYAGGFVFDSRDWSAIELAEYFKPVRAEDSAAQNMQHMAVVRDFRIAPGE